MMIVAPGVLNIVQFWIVDNFIKGGGGDHHQGRPSAVTATGVLVGEGFDGEQVYGLIPNTLH